MKRFFVILTTLCTILAGPVVLTTAAQAQVNCTGVAAWSANSVSYAVGNLVTYSGSEYKCLQAHTSQSAWNPVAAPSLWSDVGACASTTSSTTGSCSATPSAPGTPTASGTTSTGTSLSWGAVTPPANCTISSYEVYENGTALASSSTTSYTVSGLTASTTYKFTVAAVDSDGTGAQSASVSVTTSAASGGEGPYGGTAAAIPGTVQAENYDTGGQGVGYSVTSVNGTANSYRTDGVDIEATTDTGGGYNIGWTAAGQWFRYTVNVATAGTYNVSYRVSNGSTASGSFHIQNAAGTNLSGSVTVPTTGGWQTWTTVTGTVTLPAGQQVLTVSQDTGGYNINYIAYAAAATCSAAPSAPSTPTASGTTSSVTSLSWGAVTPPANCSISGYEVYENGTALASTTSTTYAVSGLAASTTYSFTVAAVDSDGTGAKSSAVSVTTSAASGGEGPYGGTAAAIPGTVQAENYDTGGQGVGYSVTSVNGTANSYRTDGVDIEVTTDTGGGYNIGWTAAGQWFRYTVNVATAGTYSVSYRVSNGSTASGSFHIQNASGTNLSGSITVPTTGGWQTWTTVTGTVTLPAGQQVLTVSQDTGGYNFNYIAFSTAASCSATPSAPATPTASGTTSSGTSLSWGAVTPPANCSISSYEVYENGTALASTTSTSYSVSGLAASTSYNFTVAAVDSDGTGAQSSAVSVTTSSGGAQGTCDVPWNATTAYVGGNLVSQAGVNYTANYDSTGSSPATNSGGVGSGEPWIPVGFCTVCSATAPAPSGLSASGTTASTTNLSWSAPTPPSGCSLTGYTIYENGTAVAYDVPGTSYTVTCLSPSTAYTFAVAVTDGTGPSTWGLSAKSSTVGVTTSSGSANSCTPGNIGKPAMIGYWESYSSATLASVANGYDVIAIAFALPGGTDGATVALDTTDESAANIASDVATLHSQGKKVIISVGGENATNVELSNSTDVSNFVNSVEGIISQFGLDGVDLDLENETLELNVGDNDYTKPTTPSTVNLITAMNTLAAKYGSNFIYTMAPQTSDIDGVGHYGTTGGLGWGDFLPLIYNTRSILTYVMTQNYNSGQDYGLDGNIYTESTADFNVAITELLLHGMTLAPPSVNPEFPSINPKQVVMGVPATSPAAGSGYLAPSGVLSAVSYLMEGTADGGSYKLEGGPYPTFGGVMTWDCDYDSAAGYPMESVIAPYIHAH